MPWSVLSDRTGLSRPALGTLVAELRRDRLTIEESSEGVRYESHSAMLHPDETAAWIQTRWWGRKVYTGAVLSSTIDIAKALATTGAPQGTLILANQQTQGRGRHGQRWVSRPGNDILLTFILRQDGLNPAPSLLSLYAALGVARVLDTAYHLPIQLKWPNDLVIGQNKLGGVLAERLAAPPCILVSLGLNVFSKPPDWPPDCRASATSLTLETREPLSRPLLTAQCGIAWELLWDEMGRDGGAAVLGYWNRYSTLRGQRVRLHYRNEPLTGRVREINPEGRLALEDPHGRLLHLVPEEVRELREIRD
jgi:BirA family biotin operon repressor/biotin-[acetyl-CoA-carboxylase] ligase